MAAGGCHPTTGKNYSISLADSYSITGPNETAFIGNFGTGITPIMTVFFPNVSSTTGATTAISSWGSPELHLTCMRTVGSLAGCVGCSASSGISDLIRPIMPLAMMAAIAVVALLFG
jgi:hypothetical protein